MRIAEQPTNDCNPIKLSVIIPCLNAASTIGDQLESFATQYWSKPWELIIVNNGSTDGTLDVVERYMERIPNLRVSDASARRGRPFARNAGIEAAQGESVAFTDADDVVSDGYVAAIGEALETHEFVACRVDTNKLNPAWLAAARNFAQATGLQQYYYP